MNGTSWHQKHRQRVCHDIKSMLWRKQLCDDGKCQIRFLFAFYMLFLDNAGIMPGCQTISSFVTIGSTFNKVMVWYRTVDTQTHIHTYRQTHQHYNNLALKSWNILVEYWSYFDQSQSVILFTSPVCFYIHYYQDQVYVYSHFMVITNGFNEPYQWSLTRIWIQ